MVAQSNFLILSIIFLDTVFFSFFLKHTPYCALFLQLEIEVLKFFDATISNFSLVVREFKLKDGIWRNKSWE